MQEVEGGAGWGTFQGAEADPKNSLGKWWEGECEQHFSTLWALLDLSCLANREKTSKLSFINLCLALELFHSPCPAQSWGITHGNRTDPSRAGVATREYDPQSRLPTIERGPEPMSQPCDTSRAPWQWPLPAMARCRPYSFLLSLNPPEQSKRFDPRSSKYFYLQQELWPLQGLFWWLFSRVF